MEILTPVEECQYAAVKKFIIVSAGPESLRVKAQYYSDEVSKLVSGGLDAKQAEQVVKARCKGHLYPDDILQGDDGRLLTVREILASPDIFNGMTFRDPLESEAGSCKAKFFSNAGSGPPVIHSQLHGGMDYFLTNPPEIKTGKTKWFNAALALGSVSRFVDNPPPPLDWVLEGTLLARTTGMIVGPGAVGKSTLALLIGIAVATGRDILPGIFTPTRAGKVLCVFAEDDEDILHHRIHALVDKLFYLDREARDLLRQNMRVITTTGHDVRFLNASMKTLEESEFFREVFEAIKDLEDLRLILFDPESRFHGADENDNGAGTYFVSLMEQIAQITGAAVVFLHHVTKKAGIGNNGFDLEAAMHQDAARGASGLTNGVRWQCNLFGLPESYAKKEMGIKQARPGQYLALRVSKKNYGSPEDQHFLERGQGGMLSVLMPAARVNDPDLDVIVKRLLLDAVFKAEGMRLTQRLLVDGNHQAWKKENPKVTRAAVEQTIAACIVNGELFERQGKNASGKAIVYLSRYPEPSANLEPENPFEPEMEPEAFKPEEPEGTVKNELPVHNLLNLENIVNPERMNRKKDPLRFVSARNCGTVEPEIFTPYGGDISPSGLDRVDTPLLPMEAEDAEFF